MKKPIIIGCVARKRAGKDTAAKYLASLGFRRLAFADRLYEEVAEAFGVSVAFLRNETTKETPLPELRLSCCRDAAFVAVALAERTKLAEAETSAAMEELNSPRYILQLWGTEYRRKNGVDDYWLRQVREQIEADSECLFVLTDVRFPNEAKLIQELGGVLLRIHRPALDGLTDATLLHSSETAMLEYPTDYTVTNEEGNPDALGARVRELAATLLTEAGRRQAA